MEALMDLNPAALPPRKRLKSLGSSASPPSTPTTPPPHRSSPLAGPSTRPSSETNAQTTLLKRKQPEPREKEEELFIFSNQGIPPRKATAPHIKPRGNPSPFPSDSEPEQPRRGRPGRKPGSSKKPIKRPRKEPLYCLCRQPYDEEVFMIACDVCNDWFHGECVGMTERKAQSLKTYICPPCTKSRATGGRRKSVVKEETEDERVNVDGDSGDEGEESPQEFQRSRREASANMRGRRGSTTTAVVTSATRRRSIVSSGISRMSHVDEESAQVATGETDSSKEDIAPRRVCANKSCHHSAKPNSKYCSTECGVHVATQFLEKQKAAAMAAAAAAAPEQMRIASPKPSPKPGDASLSSSNDDLPNFSSIKRSLENSPDISAADDTDLKQLESLERQRREVEQNLRSLAVKRGDFEQAVRFSATLFATPSATSASTSSDQGSQEAPEVMDCFSCGQPIAGRNFARHIEQCYTKKEGINTTSSGAVLLSASKLEARTRDDGAVIAFCNRYDATREAYCAHVLDSCPVHSDKKGLDERRLCGCPTSDFKSGHCERLRSECVKHFNWENIRKMEMKLEKKRQTQLLGSLDAEIELVKTRIRRRNQTRDDEHRTIEENGASNTRQHSPASK